MKRRNSWSAAEIEYLRLHYGKQKTRAIAQHLRRTYSATWACTKARSFAPVPTQEGLRRARRPANSTASGYAPGRMKETQFKKGERRGRAALNWVPHRYHPRGLGGLSPDQGERGRTRQRAVWLRQYESVAAAEPLPGIWWRSKMATGIIARLRTWNVSPWPRTRNATLCGIATRAKWQRRFN